MITDLYHTDEISSQKDFLCVVLAFSLGEVSAEQSVPYLHMHYVILICIMRAFIVSFIAF